MELSIEEKLLNTVLTKAWEDEQFKAELIADPVGAIKNLTGQQITIPEGKKIIVTDQTNTSKVFLNIPTEPDMEDMELSEEHLDVIAGGGGTVPPIVTD